LLLDQTIRATSEQNCKHGNPKDVDDHLSLEA
jgi:hypothetical protein